MAKPKIYYKIYDMKDCTFELHSLIMTSFGGWAENYVKHSKDKQCLKSFAENNGWIEFEE